MNSKLDIRNIKTSAKIISSVVQEIKKFLKPGIQEKDIANFIRGRLKEYGSSPSFKIIVASSKRTALPHGYATKKTIRKNDIVMVDCGAKYKGVCSDITRMFFLKNGSVFVKPIDKNHKRIFNIVQKTKSIAEKMLTDGVKVKEIDLAVRKVFKRYGVEKNFLHSTGHGIGKKVHEKPKISFKSDAILKEGMIVTIEPGLYFKNSFGIRIEDMFLIKKNGCEKLTF